MATIFYEHDANPNALKGKTIAILGYGSQGHAQAQNLRDSGCKVIVGLEPNRPSAQQARADGMVVVAPDEAAKRADWIHVLTPDELKRRYTSSTSSLICIRARSSVSHTASAFISRPSLRRAMWMCDDRAQDLPDTCCGAYMQRVAACLHSSRFNRIPASGRTNLRWPMRTASARPAPAYCRPRLTHRPASDYPLFLGEALKYRRGFGTKSYLYTIIYKLS